MTEIASPAASRSSGRGLIRGLRRAAAWVAARASGARSCRVFAAGFALLHALLWTVILTVIKGAQDIHFDTAEAYEWGQRFLLGYGKHPPLSGWIAGLWFRVFPAADWAAYALAMATLAASLYVCFEIALRVVDRRRAAFTLVLLAVSPGLNFKGFKYNADLVQLVTLPLIVWAFLVAFERRDWRSGIWLGLAAAAGLMTKYWALTMIGAIGLAALAHPQRLAFLRSPAPWVAVGVCAVLMVPHLYWLAQADFLPLTYAQEAYAEFPVSVTRATIWVYVAHNIFFISLLTLALGWTAVIGWSRLFDWPWLIARSRAVRMSAAINIWLVQAIVAIAPPLAGFVLAIYMKADWGIPLFFLVPLCFVAIPRLRLQAISLIHIIAIWLGFTLAMLAAAPVIAAKGARGENSSLHHPVRELAQQLTTIWHQRFGTRWAIVVGFTEAAQPMSFYSADHPDRLTQGEPWGSGLSTFDDARRLGFIGVCDPSDAGRLPACEAWMRDNAKGERIEVTAQRSHRGMTGRPATWIAYVVGPGK